METARLKAFLCATQTGSFSKAAEILRYTPSGVSQLVNSLEDELGFPLLLRNRRGVSLTANGQLLLPAIQELLAQEKRIEQMAAEVKGLAVGSITVAAFSSIAIHWLPDIIKSFQDQYPQISISLMGGIRQEVCDWLDNKQADVGFFSYQEPMPYDWLPLAKDRMLAVLPLDHPLAGAAAYPLKNCVNERFIMTGMGRDDDVAKMMENNNIKPQISFITREYYAAIALVEKSLGMSIMNELITRHCRICDAVMIPLDPPQEITMGLAVPSLKEATPAVRCFVDFAVKKLSRPDALTD